MKNETKYYLMAAAVVIVFLLACVVMVSATTENGHTGSLTVQVRCAHNIFSNEMILANNEAPSENISIYLLPDGQFNDRYVAGDYTLTLLDGNSGKPETAQFRINEDYNTLVPFIGHAVSVIREKEHVPVEVCHDERIYIPGHFEFTCWQYHGHTFCWPVWVCGHWETITVCEMV
jgi:hypothetical protein